MERLERIAEHVCGATGYDLAALRMKSRDVFLVAARQLFCYYARAAGYPLVRIGAFIGVHHSTALYSATRIELIKDIDRIVKDYVKRYEIMSKRKAVIEITPPECQTFESDVVRGVFCPLCAGGGIVEADGVIKCGRCGGSGRLRAYITISWMADKE